MGDALYSTGTQLPGTVYRIVRHLATGGMGSVYDVEDVTVGKRYVLKTLHPQLVSREDLARRMEAEARTLGRLQHPNIVDVVTAGVTGDASRMPFYVMERLNGQNLRVVLDKRGVIELEHAFRIAIDVLDALEHAHENGVIHRDVKPENIFLHRQINGTTITKLLDFGIMRLLDRKCTQTQGKFIGTLRYASPEQLLGGELGPGTDIYSLGAVLYEMIAGRGPFDDAGDAYAIGAAHAHTAPPPLSLFTQLPPRVEALVMSALAKTPAERPRDCFTFASGLRRMLGELEAAPRSATAVNVLGSPTRADDGALDGTVSAASPELPRTAPLPPQVAGAVAGTLHGMSEPSRLGPPLELAPSVPGPAPLASTLLAGKSSAPAAPLDRSAETRTSVPFGHTQRLASHGTQIDGLEPGPGELQEALGRPEPLVVPPITGPVDGGAGIPRTRGAPPDAGELVFARPSSAGAGAGSFGTGPLAGEARTRPPERSIALPLLGALAVGLAMVGGAVVLVKSRLAREATGASAQPTDVAPPASASAEAPPPSSTSPSATSTATPSPVATTPPVSSATQAAPPGPSPTATSPPRPSASSPRATTTAASPPRPSATAAPAAPPRPRSGPAQPAAAATTAGPRPAKVPGFDD